MRDVTKLQDFKADLLRWLETCNDESRDIYVQHAALIKVLEAFVRFAEVWDDEVYEKLAPVLNKHCKELANLINGRQPEAFTRAPRKGKPPPDATLVQAQARAAVYMHLRVTEIGKDRAKNEASRKFKLDPHSIEYWREHAMKGVLPWAELFRHDLAMLRAQHPTPEKQAKALLDAHRRSPQRSSGR
jgi:hypothetical protein